MALAVEEAMSSFSTLNQQVTSLAGALQKIEGQVNSFAGAWNVANGVFSQAAGVMKTVGPAVDAVGFAFQAVRLGAATAAEGVAFAAASFSPFLIGGAIAIGLVALIGILGQVREKARLAALNVSSLTSIQEAKAAVSYWDKEFKRLQDLRKKGDAAMAAARSGDVNKARGIGMGLQPVSDQELNHAGVMLAIAQAKLKELQEALTKPAVSVDQSIAESQALLSRGQSLIDSTSGKSEIQLTTEAINKQIQKHQEEIEQNGQLAKSLNPYIQKLRDLKELLNELGEKSLEKIMLGVAGPNLQKQLEQQEVLAKASGQKFNKDQAEYALQKNMATEYANAAFKEGKTVEFVLQKLGPTFARIGELEKKLAEASLKDIKEKGSGTELQKQLDQQELLAQASGQKFNKDQAEYDIQKNMAAEYIAQATKAGKSKDLILQELGPTLAKIQELEKSVKEAALDDKVKKTAESVSGEELAKQAQVAGMVAKLKGDKSFDETEFKKAALTGAVDSISKDMLAAGKSFEEIKEKVQPLIDQLDEIDTRSPWKKFTDGLGKLLENIGNVLLQKMPIVQNVVAAMKKAIEGKDPYTAAAMGILALLEESETFKQMLGIINPLLQVVADTVGMLLEPLLPIIQLLSMVLTPVLNMFGIIFKSLLMPVMRALFPVFRILGLVMMSVCNAIALVWNGLVGLIDMIPFVDMSAYYIDTKALADATQALADLSYDEAMAKSKLTDETNKASEAMRNVPSSFKSTLERFRIAEPPKPSTAAITANPAETAGSVEKTIGAARAETREREKVEVHVHLEGSVYGLEDFDRRVTEAVSKADVRRGMARLGLGTAGAY